MCIRDRTKTGALIVLERNTNLSEIVRTGTPVNSAVNLEVLGTIFYEGTPLHDGAAIIEDGRIQACLLYTSSAGARLMVMRRSGHLKPRFFSAA